MKNFDIPDVYIAILPCYLDDYGDGTELIDLNGDVLRIKSSVKSCLKRTLKKYAVDLSAMKEKYAKSLGIKNNFPIPLAGNFTLVQLKSRIPKVAKDVSYGYVCYEKINEIEEHSTYCIVNVGNIKIKVYQKKSTIEKHLRNAAMIKTFFANLSPLNFESDRSMYNLPATKADIALLYEEIVNIKYKIEKI